MALEKKSREKTEKMFFQMEHKKSERVKDGVKIRGFASTPDIDRHYDIVEPGAFEKGLKHYLENPVLLRSHNPDRPVGQVLVEGDEAPRVTSAGLSINALVTDKETADQVEAGELRTLSIGFIPLKSDYIMRGTGEFDGNGQELFIEARMIKELDLVEISIVSTPANPRALFTVAKSVESYFLSSPSPAMAHTCDYCDTNESASGKIGKKWICKSCIEAMELKKTQTKSDEEEGKPEEKPEEGAQDKPVEAPAPAEAAESSGEKPEGADAEEAEAEGGKEEAEKTAAPKERIKAITASLEPEKKAEPKQEESKATVEDVLEVLEKMAEAVKDLRARLSITEKALDSIPLHKGKVMVNGQFPEEKKETLLDLFKQAKATGSTITLGDGDDDE